MNELQHHGILGQKWGKHNGPPYPLNSSDYSSAERKAHYRVDILEANKKVKDAKKQYSKNHTYENKQRVRYAKEDLHTEKTKSKLNKEKFSDKRADLEAYYHKKGMNDEEAAVAAYKHSRTKKIVAGLLGATLVATAAYVAYKQYDKRVDKFIPSDVLLSRVARDGDNAVREGFYASFKKSDVSKYIGLLGGGEDKSAGVKDVFQKKISLKSGLKVASEENSRKVLSKMFEENPGYHSVLKEMLNDYVNPLDGSIKRQTTINKAIKSLDKGVVDRSVYRSFNMTLGKGVDQNQLGKKFYDVMRKKGYDAIDDVHDKFMSGYNSKSPAIVFNTSKVRKVMSKQLDDDFLKQKFVTERIKLTTKNLAKRAGVATGIVGGVKGTRTYSKTRKNDRIVAEYKKKHPNTEMSYYEIIRSYEQSRSKKLITQGLQLL